MNERERETAFTTPEHHDKTAWGDGPWLDEPDKVVWIDGTTDLDCMIHRNRHGALCGYVGVPVGHPLYGKHRSEIFVDVYDGVTYAAPCVEESTPEHGLCHVPAPGRSDDVWWIGFAAAGAWDVAPARQARERVLGWNDIDHGETYKPLAFVRAEVRRLAAQLAELA